MLVNPLCSLFPHRFPEIHLYPIQTKFSRGALHPLNGNAREKYTKMDALWAFFYEETIYHNNKEILILIPLLRGEEFLSGESEEKIKKILPESKHQIFGVQSNPF